MKFIEQRVSDQRFLGLIHQLLVAPTLDENQVPQANHLGVPQGSILSPVLANIFLHHVIDLWIEELKNFFSKPVHAIRFADDMVFVFGDPGEASRFFATLPKRLAKYGLEMAAEKSSLVPCGTWSINRLMKAGKPMPKFKFLGFEITWVSHKKRDRRGERQYRPRLKPRRDRMSARLKDINKFLRDNRTARNHTDIILKIRRVMMGWVNYFAVSDCGNQVWCFRTAITRMLFRWFNRRGKRGAMNWDKFRKILDSLKFQAPVGIKSIYRSSQNATKVG
jgi:hypothetical protein